MRRGGFDVAVDAFKAGLLQPRDVGWRQEAERTAEVDARLAPHGAKGVAKRVDVGRALGPPACDNADAPHAVRLGVRGGLDAGFGANPAVAFASCLPVCALGAPLAVFGAAAGTGVDDAAEVEAARRAGDGDAVRGLVEFVARGVAEKV